MVEQAVEDGGGQCRIVVEDLRPVLEHAIGGDCDGTAFISLTDDLELSAVSSVSSLGTSTLSLLDM